MSNRAIAHNYAQAFFEAALDTGMVDTVISDVKLIKACLTAAESFLSRLNSPGISQTARLKIMETAFGNSISEISRNFLFLVLKHNRQNLFIQIFDEFESIVDKSRNKLNAKVTSAQQLSSDQQQKIKKMLQQKTGYTFDIQFRTDPKLLAGFVLVYGEKMYDCSTASALNRFRDTLKSIR